jgi:hypothetical protein
MDWNPTGPPPSTFTSVSVHHGIGESAGFHYDEAR